LLGNQKKKRRNDKIGFLDSRIFIQHERIWIFIDWTTKRKERKRGEELTTEEGRGGRRHKNLVN